MCGGDRYNSLSRMLLLLGRDVGSSFIMDFKPIHEGNLDYFTLMEDVVVLSLLKGGLTLACRPFEFCD